MTAPLRWGLVGTGAVSEAIAADLSLGDAQAVAVCSRSESRAAAFGDRHGIASRHLSLDSFLDDESVDLVYIATPHATHLEIGLAALAAGKHVVIEKPIALSGDEARALAEAAATADVFLMEAMWMRFNPAFRDLLAVIESGRIGEPRSVRASFGAPFPRDGGSRWQAELGGSTLLDQGIYTVELARAVLGDPDRVSSSAVWSAPQVDATTWTTLEWEDGRFAQLSSSMVECLEPSATVHGTTGWVRLEPPFWTTSALAIHSGEMPDVLFKPERRDYPREGNGYTPMIRSIGEAVRAGRTQHPWCPMSETMATFDLLDRVRAAFSSSSSSS